MPSESSFYIVDGQQVRLRSVSGAKLVTPADGQSPLNVAARLSRSSRLALDTQSTGERIVVRGEPDKLEEIRGYRDVANTRAVFVDPTGLEFALTNDVLVRFEDETTDDERLALVEGMGARVVSQDGHLWTVRVRDDGDDAPLLVANEFAALDGVEYSEPNALQAAEFQQLAPAPTDGRYANQWHLENTGQGRGTVGADVSAREAWFITRGSSAVRICIHDSGVDIDHPDLIDNMDPGRDFDNDDNNASNNAGPHGTACAGVAAARQNNQGVVGIAPLARIVPLRAAGAHPWSTWAQTFRWAAKRADIISCSWTISANNTLSAAIRKAAREGRDGRGIPIFFATGNGGGSSIGYPASLADTMAVGASTNRDVRASYSQFGTGLDFVAPSGGGTRRIETTDVVGAAGYASGDYTSAADATGFSGTSSATPLAAGIGALVLSANAALSAGEVRDIMRDTAEQIDAANAGYGASGFSNQYGHGRLDAGAAVAEAVDRRARRADGDFVVTWMDDRDQNGVYEVFARGLRINGQERFSEMTVNSVSSGQQSRPRIGLDEDGNSVTVWQDDQDGNGYWQILARGLTPDSNERFGDITVNTAGAGQQLRPDVAVAPNGDFVVVWEDDKDKNGLYQIMARGFRSNGTQKFSDITVNTAGAGQQRRPRVGIAANGQFVVVWEDDKDKNGFYQIMARGFRSNGQEKFSDITVNTAGAGQQRRPAIAVAPNGHFVVVWEDDKDKNGFYQIMARGFNSNGNQRIADFVVNTAGAGQQLRPDVAVVPNGDFVVVWEDDKDRNRYYQIMARGFNATGSQKFSDRTVNTAGAGQQRKPQVGMAADGEFVVVWEDDKDRNGFYQIMARGFRANGTQRFSDRTINQVGDGQQFRPAIGVAQNS